MYDNNSTRGEKGKYTICIVMGFYTTYSVVRYYVKVKDIRYYR